MRDDVDFVLIGVSDQGPATVPEHHERIFERLDRVDNAARSHDKRGPGRPITKEPSPKTQGRTNALNHDCKVIWKQG